ncbi:MAG TPA: universal stress protein [Candidatus Limnocylindria bacterium]|nr:universal stress protein [Candidatus Limnocylindria bacterium]
MRALLGLDGSTRADVARQLVEAVAWPPATSLRTVLIVDEAATLLAGPWSPFMGSQRRALEDALVAHAEELLDEASRQLEVTGLGVEPLVLRGRPATLILEQATDWPAQLVVLGSRGHGRLGTALLGSVSAEVVDHAPCPVLIARVPRLERVVLAHDGSAYARAAEDTLAGWPIFRRASVEVVSVAPATAAWRSPAGVGLAAQLESHAHVVQASLVEHRAIAEEASARLAEAGLDASAAVLQGDPAESIVEHAATSRADLIVSGTHGRTGIARVLLGSVARNVMLHAACSVLVVRGGSSAGGPSAGDD